VGAVVKRIVSERAWPSINVDPNDEEAEATSLTQSLLQKEVDQARLRTSVHPAIRDLVGGGSGAFGFTLIKDRVAATYLDHVWCEPVFAGAYKLPRARQLAEELDEFITLERDSEGAFLPGADLVPDDLVMLRYEYPIDEELSRSKRGSPELSVRTWIRVDYLPTVTIEYKPVEVRNGNTKPPVFEPIRPIVAHNKGVVPVVWMTPEGTRQGEFEGMSLLPPSVLKLSDRADYASSSADDANELNCHPLLVFVDLEHEGFHDRVRAGSTDPGYVDTTAGAVLMMKSGGSENPGQALMLKPGSEEANASRKHIQRLERTVSRITGVPNYDPENIRGTLTGRAYEKLVEPFIFVVDSYKTPLGEALRQWIVKVAVFLGMEVPEKVNIEWAEVFTPTATDKELSARAWTMLNEGGVLSDEDVSRGAALDAGISDVDGAVRRAVAQREKDKEEEVRNTPAPALPATP
jgi:hypothetical protein